MSDKHAHSRRHPSRREVLLAGGSLLAVTALGSLTGAGAKAQTAGKKPNILVIFGDDIGWWNTSAYNRGQMGYQTPNIDRIADEGAIFTDLYAQQSCTAGRAAFITGQAASAPGSSKLVFQAPRKACRTRIQR